MRKLLLLVLGITTTTLFSNAQKSLITIDSTYFGDSQGNLILSLSDIYLYNSDCLDTSLISYYIDAGKETKRISDYYPDNKLYHQTYQHLDTAKHTYLNDNRITYYYNTSNQISNTKTELWVNNNWQPSSMDIYTYNSLNKLDTVLSQYWDSAQQIYVDQNRSIYRYDTGGRESSYLYQSRDANSGSWFPYLAYTHTYNKNGFLVDYTVSFTDFFTNVYGLAQHQVYYPDNKGIVDSSYQVNYDYDDSTRYYNTYYSPSTKVKLQTYYSYQFSGIFNGGGSTYFYYDSTGRNYIDSSVNKGLPTAPDSASVYHINITENSYNAFGQQTHFLSRYISNGVSKNNREDFIHYSVCSGSLPLTFLNFSGQQKNNNALLKWQTSNELNTSYFNLQRSIDGEHFKTIGKIKTIGNNAKISSYTYTDSNINLLKSKEIYYRLAEIDNDGSTTYSKTIQISVSNNQNFITILPNPIQNTIYLSSSVSLENAMVKITNITGTILYNNYLNIQPGIRISIDASRFAKGMYVVTIQSKDSKEIYKILK